MTRIKVLVLLLAIACLLGAGPASAGERFTVNGDGTVTDHELGLMWAESDTMGDIGWKDARLYCRQGPPQALGKYDNWRMPTPDELASLYDRNAPARETECGQKIRIIGPMKLSCGWVWSSEERSITAVVFNFHRGYRYTDRMVHKRNYRALPVRDLK